MTSANRFSETIDVLKCDLRSRNQSLSLKTLVKDPIARFHFYLRFTEHYAHQSRSPLYLLFKWRFLVLSVRLGFSIPENTLGRGVYLPHHGTIVVNSRSYIGDFSVLNVDVVIGRHPGSKAATPTLGKGVFVGPGAKLFGRITIGDCSVIGANSVVTHSVPERVLCAGVPADIKRAVVESEYRDFIAAPEARECWRAAEDR